MIQQKLLVFSPNFLGDPHMALLVPTSAFNVQYVMLLIVFGKAVVALFELRLNNGFLRPFKS